MGSNWLYLLMSYSAGTNFAQTLVHYGTARHGGFTRLSEWNAVQQTALCTASLFTQNRAQVNILFFGTCSMVYARARRKGVNYRKTVRQKQSDEGKGKEAQNGGKLTSQGRKLCSPTVLQKSFKFATGLDKRKTKRKS